MIVAVYAAESNFEFPLDHRPFPRPLEGLASQLQLPNGIAVHVRRGDYVDNKRIRGDYLVCGLDYYKGSMKRLGEHYPDARFFLFSDNPGWLQAQDWSPLQATVIPPFPGIGDEIVLKLFSTAHHQIISNSTFSWWGAYHNNRPGKTVIAPSQRRRGLPSRTLVGTLIPNQWLLNDEGVAT